jgi:hypothetical protein
MNVRFAALRIMPYAIAAYTLRFIQNAVVKDRAAFDRLGRSTKWKAQQPRYSGKANTRCRVWRESLLATRVRFVISHAGD